MRAARPGRAANVLGRPRTVGLAASMTRTAIANHLVAVAGPCVLFARMDLDVTLATGVSVVGDQSPSGNSLSQATAGLQPAFSKNGANGTPAASADGTDDQLQLAGVALGASNTIVAVMSKSTSASKYLVANNLDNGFISNFAGVSFEWFNTPDRQTFSAGATGLHSLVLAQVDGTSCVGEFDGVQAFSIVPTVALSGSTLSRYFTASAGGSASTSTLAETAVFSSSLPLSWRRRIEAEHINRYAL